MPNSTPLKALRHYRASAGQFPFSLPQLKISSGLILFLAIASPGLAACGSDAVASAPSAVPAVCPAADATAADTVVLAATATSAEPALSLPPVVGTELERAAATDHGCLVLVVSGQQPRSLSLTPRRSTGDVERGQNRKAREHSTVQAVQADIAHAAAGQDGLDLRNLLGEVIRVHPAPGVLVVVSSGVSTAPPVDLRQVGWDTDGGTVGRWLRDNRWLPDLTGWRIRFVGLGDAAGTQAELPDPTVRWLTDLWLGICRATGATECLALPGSGATAASGSTRPVPPVPVPAVQQYPGGARLPASALFSLNSADLSATADATLVDVVRRATLGQLAVSVLGHTDAVTGTPESNRDLSVRRAVAVRNRLVGLGLPADRILKVQGLGSRGFTPAEERANPALVAAHRQVEIRYTPVR